MKATDTMPNDPRLSGAANRTLDAIFRHPVAHDVQWREIMALFSAFGEVEEKHNGDVMVSIGEGHMSLGRPRDKTIGVQDAMEPRHHLVSAGWTPEGGPAAGCVAWL